MRKSIPIAVAAALAVGGFTFTATQAEDAAVTERPAVRAVAPKLPAGIAARDIEEPSDIREELGDIIDDIVAEDGFEEFVDQLRDEDQERMELNDFADENDEALNGVIKPFLAAWKLKYKEDFDLEANAAKSFGELAMITGEVVNPAMLTEWPVNPAPAKNDQAKPGVEKAPIERDAAAPARQVLEKGQNVAIVTLPAQGRYPELHLSMIEEDLGQWHIDIPDTITGPQLLANLGQAFKDLDVKTLPDNINLARAVVAHRIFMAAYGINPTDAEQAAPANKAPAAE